MLSSILDAVIGIDLEVTEDGESHGTMIPLLGLPSWGFPIEAKTHSLKHPTHLAAYSISNTDG